jgi:hypothetical protein
MHTPQLKFLVLNIRILINASRLPTLLLVPVLDVQGHNLSSYQVSFPFVGSHLEQEFLGILQNAADMLKHYIRVRVI